MIKEIYCLSVNLDLEGDCSIHINDGPQERPQRPYCPNINNLLSVNLALEGDCYIESTAQQPQERPQRPYKILGMSAKFGSLQGGRRVQCSSDSNDDIVLGTFTEKEWPQSGLGNSTTLSYIASEKNHDELRYDIYFCNLFCIGIYSIYLARAFFDLLKYFYWAKSPPWPLMSGLGNSHSIKSDFENNHFYSIYSILYCLRKES